MTPYANLNGNSGVARYDVTAESITVEFSDGSAYLYDYNHTGRGAVDAMKQFAVSGRGLNGYISRFVKTRYARKLR